MTCPASSPLHAAPRSQANDDSKADTAGLVCGTRVVEAPYSKLQPVPFEQVRIDEGFWAPRIKLLQEVTIPMLLNEEQKPARGRVLDGPKKIRNFDVVAGRSKQKLYYENCPDSDIYKVLEGAALSLASRRDARLEALLDSVIGRIAAAQAPDGYLNTQYMLPEDHPSFVEVEGRRLGRGMKWRGTIAEWSQGIGQFYCAGHLMEAASAHYRVTGKENFLRVATRLADHICGVFPVDRPIEYADHPQLGIGLMKLHEVTGRDRYLKMARHYVENGKHSRPVDHGKGESHKKLSEQRKAYGHCVRTCYLYSSATDVCRYLDEPELRVALDSLWHSLVDRRFFIHGGLGDARARSQGHWEDFQLAPHSCYAESCANIAMAQWNHRLNLALGDTRYADLVEWEMYNGGLSGLSRDGRRFFYPNPLGQPRSRGYKRWSFCFCCPSKLTTFVGGIGRWVYARDAEALYVNQYVASTADISHPRGRLRVIQRNDYPWEGELAITVEPDEPVALTLALRIPGWVHRPGPFPSPLYRFGDPGSRLDEVALEVNGRKTALPALEDGYVRLHRRWEPGDEVRLVLPMPVRRMYADERATELNGMVAVSRGPVLYSLEQPDNKGVPLFDVSLPAEAPFEVAARPELLGGVHTIKTRGRTPDHKEVPLEMIPYYAWQNRGLHDMTTWLVESSALLDGPPKPYTGNAGSEGTVVLSCPLHPAPAHHLDAIRDGHAPKRSDLKEVPRVSWWPQKGRTGWVDYRFEKPVETGEISVYWFQDAPRGGCKTPASWRLLYREPEGKWREVKATSPYATAVNRPNRLTFERISTKALRLEVRMQEGFSAGLYEWHVERFDDDRG